MPTQFPISRFRRELTPFYYYDMELLRDTIAAVQAAASVDSRFRVEYAVKANNNSSILRAMANAGFGADCVSGGEITEALRAGIPAEKISYAGVGKTDMEIRMALNHSIGCFNVESLAELEVIDMIASETGTIAPVALRVNPDIDAHTHHYITTGLAENKFGISLTMLDSVIDKALALPNIRLTGLHFHIGSQITISDPFRILCERVNRIVASLAGHGVRLESVNMGGGLGIDYDDPDANPISRFDIYFQTFHDHLDLPAEMEVKFELGRSLVAQCGSLITRVLYVKEGDNKRFAIVDAGMTDLIRPALYGAHHAIQNLTAEESGKDEPMLTYDVVGPVCESADQFAADELLPVTRRGDLLAIRSAGAYGRVMASTYNSRQLPPELLFN